MKNSSLFKRNALDLLIFLFAPLIFLLLYTQQYAVSHSAVLPHLRLVLLAWFALGLLRLGIALLVRPISGQRWFSALLISSVLYCMLLYYGTVLIGLRSWGRVISWGLVGSYLGQARELASALEVSFAGVLCGAIAAYLLLLALSWHYLKRFDWAGHLVQAGSGKFFAVLLAAGSALIALQILSFFSNASTTESEPLSLSFFAADAALHLQNNAIDRLSAAKMDSLDAAARAAYRINPQADRKNVILIVVDALRPDHMSLYGYARDTTPHLQKRTALRAPTIRASCGESACGSFSLLTSKYIHQFSENPFTLQQVLKLYDYRIHMILSSDHTNFYGLRKLYGKVDSYFDGSSKAGKYGNDDQLVLEQTKLLAPWDGHPTMFQFHLMSNHVLGIRHQAAKFTPAANYAFDRQRGQGQTASPRAVNFYDNGVLETDLAIHSILETLKDKGYLKNATVVITADHGELLGEHGLFTHANSVWEEVLQVPFVLLPFGYQSQAFSAQNLNGSQVDIAPTLLAELNMPRPSTWVGAPLQDKITRDYSYFQEGFEVGLIDHRDPQNIIKYWVNLKTGTEYAFNLSIDPHEQQNIAAQLDAQRRRLWRLQQLAPLHGAMHSKLTH